MKAKIAFARNIRALIQVMVKKLSNGGQGRTALMGIAVTVTKFGSVSRKVREQSHTLLNEGSNPS